MQEFPAGLTFFRIIFSFSGNIMIATRHATKVRGEFIYGVFLAFLLSLKGAESNENRNNNTTEEDI